MAVLALPLLLLITGLFARGPVGAQRLLDHHAQLLIELRQNLERYGLAESAVEAARSEAVAGRRRSRGGFDAPCSSSTFVASPDLPRTAPPEGGSHLS